MDTLDKNLTDSDYWAASEDMAKLSGALLDRINSYYNYLYSNGLMSKWLSAYLCYYTNLMNSASITRSGPQGEFSVMSVAEASSIIQRLLQLTISERPAWEPQSTNSDAESQRQTIVARGLLDYYMTTKRVEKDLQQAVEYGFIFGEGYVSVNWDASSGEIYALDPLSNKPTNEGDLKYRSHEPIDVIRDLLLNSYRDRDWLIVRDYVNRYELMAKYPDFKDKIRAVDQTVPYNQHYRIKNILNWESDVIPYFRFYHSKSASLNQGRYTEMLPDGTILLDGPLPYGHVPVYRTTPRDVVGSSFGHAYMYDLLPLQQFYDMVMSSILSTNDAFGIPNILVPLNSGLNHIEMAGGFSYLEYDPNLPKPEPMVMPQPPESMYRSLEIVSRAMEEVTNINAVTRGNLPSADLSGAALALLQSMAIQANQGAQLSYTQLLEDVGTATVQILRDYAEIPRVITITGKNNKSSSMDFNKDKISSVDRVLVKAGNPLTKTTSGKVTVAQMLLDAGVIKSADELLQVIQTGSLDPMIQGKTKQLLGLEQENEALMDGEEVEALVIDDHILHISEHSSVLADPEARRNPKIVANVTKHLLQHVTFLTDPQYKALLTILGQPIADLEKAGVTKGQAEAVGEANGALEQPQADANAQVQEMQPNLPSMPKPLLENQPGFQQ